MKNLNGQEVDLDLLGEVLEMVHDTLLGELLQLGIDPNVILISVDKAVYINLSGRIEPIQVAVELHEVSKEINNQIETVIKAERGRLS